MCISLHSYVQSSRSRMNRLNDNRHIPFVHQSHEQRMLLEASIQFAVFNASVFSPWKAITHF